MKSKASFLSFFSFLMIFALILGNFSVALGAESEEYVNVIEDTDEKKIVKTYDDGVLYYTINDKLENIITVYTIVENETVDTKVYDLNVVFTASPSPKILIPVQSATEFGYGLDTPENSFRCSEELMDIYNLPHPGIYVPINTYSNYQEDFIDAVDAMINLEAQLRELLPSNNFLTIIAMIGQAVLDPASVFEAALNGTDLDRAERSLAAQIQAHETIAASRYLFLWDFRTNK